LLAAMSIHLPSEATMPLLDDPARLRRIMLWVMLSALAASGLLAVIGIIGNDWDQQWRMIWSGIAAVVAAGLMLGDCKLLDSEKARRTGLFIMALIVIQFILVLLACWDPLRAWAVNDSQTKEALTALLFLVVAVPAIIFFHVLRIRGGAVSGYVGLSGSAAAYFLFLTATWTWSLSFLGGPDDDRIWETAWGAWFFVLAAAACSAGAGIDRRYWRWLGIIASAAAFVIALYNIWKNSSAFINFFTVATTLGILIAHANIIFLCKLKGRQEWLRWATVASALFAGAVFDYGAITEAKYDLVWRIASAAAICAGCGTVAVAILAAFNRRPATHAAGDGVDAREISVNCPVCLRKQSVPLSHGAGEASCGGCGMIFHVRVSAPRCAACGYLLLMFHGDVCPECGAKVSTAKIPLSQGLSLTGAPPTEIVQPSPNPQSPI
jgi:hypothetical protein